MRNSNAMPPPFWAGATHLSVRFSGSDDERQMEVLAEMREELST